MWHSGKYKIVGSEEISDCLGLRGVNLLARAMTTFCSGDVLYLNCGGIYLNGKFHHM